MEIQGKKAVIVGGASGMAKASAELLRQKGADIAILDLPNSAGAEVAKELGGTFHEVDILDDAQTESAMADAVAALGGLHIAVNTAGGGTAKRTLSKDGPHPLDDFRRTIELNLIGTFNLNRLQAFHMSTNEPEDGERGVIIDTASIAAFEGQIGQVAYAAAKAGIAGMVFTMARDLGSLGIRAMAIAPSLFSHRSHRGHPRRVRRRADQGRRLPQADGSARGVRQARRRHRREPDAQRLCIRLDAGSASPPSRSRSGREQGGAVRSTELQMDVTEAAGLGEPAHIALTVTAPHGRAGRPRRVLRQAGRRLLPGLLHRGSARTGRRAGRAGRLACRARLDLRRGRPPRRRRQLAPRCQRLSFARSWRRAQAAEAEVRQKLAAGHPDGRAHVPCGSGDDRHRPVDGRRLTMVQQGRLHCYDGIGVLGFSPCAPSRRRGRARRRSRCPGWHGTPCRPRGSSPTRPRWPSAGARVRRAERRRAMAWGFHYDDIDPAVVPRDMDDYPARHGDIPPWGSATIP